jgi:hypothetical protein
VVFFRVGFRAEFRDISPLTETSPFSISSSAPRREAIPAWAISLFSLSTIKERF